MTYPPTHHWRRRARTVGVRLVQRGRALAAAATLTALIAPTAPTFLTAVAALATPAAEAQTAPSKGDWAAVRDGTVVLLRHANAPGTGDPAGFRLGDCATQRNLDDDGRFQARRIGEAFRSRGVIVGAVLSSRWCRAQDTAELAFPGQRRDEPAFDSFFGGQGDRERQTARAKALVAGWQGPGAMVVVTHQVNITALTGVYPASGEGVIVRGSSQGIDVVGRVMP